jgi:hypothetical protein
VTRTPACLLGGLVAFVLIGWGAGVLWTSLIGSAEVEVMRELAAQRSPASSSSSPGRVRRSSTCRG